MLTTLFPASLGYSWMRKKEPWQQPCGGLETTVYTSVNSHNSETIQKSHVKKSF